MVIATGSLLTLELDELLLKLLDEEVLLLDDGASLFELELPPHADNRALPMKIANRFGSRELVTF